MTRPAANGAKAPPLPADVGGSERIDTALVRRGLATSRSKAAALIKDGEVTVNGAVVSKASAVVAPNDRLEVSSNAARYVSRAAVKLATCLDELGPSAPRIQGASCLDVGASTGGFTQVLLARGARRVIALDVGHDQLDASVRHHDAVHVMEGYNARDMIADDLPYTPDVVVTDASFISLRYLLGPIRSVLTTGGRALVLVKPQFEVGRGALGRDGVVRDPVRWRQSLEDVLSCAISLGMQVNAVMPSRLPGPTGNIEFFADLVVRGDAGGERGIGHAEIAAIEAAIGEGELLVGARSQ